MKFRLDLGGSCCTSFPSHVPEILNRTDLSVSFRWVPACNRSVHFTTLPRVCPSPRFFTAWHCSPKSHPAKPKRRLGSAGPGGQKIRSEHVFIYTIWLFTAINSKRLIRKDFVSLCRGIMEAILGSRMLQGLMLSNRRRALVSMAIFYKTAWLPSHCQDDVPCYREVYQELLRVKKPHSLDKLGMVFI